MFAGSFILMANSASAAMLEFPSALFSNEFSAPKEETKIRSVLLAPYGDWPNKQGLQRVERKDAENIVNEFKRLGATASRIIGLPWYIGHPDHPAFSDRYKDTRAYGRIKDLEAKDDGLWASVKFGNEGESLIADESFHGHSVNWFLREDPKQKGVWRPYKLKSVGFTNEPNIPVPPLTSANEAANLFKRLARLRLFANQSEKKADEPSQKYNAAQIKLGAQAHKDFMAGNNPPSWVEDEAIWEKAKDAALKTYDLEDDAFWPVVVTIYENMGGGVGGANEGTVVGAMKGAVIKHGTVKAREKFSAAKERAGKSSAVANAATTDAEGKGGFDFHAKAKAAHAEAADHHVEAGNRAAALGMETDAQGHFDAANIHRQAQDKHAAAMMNEGMELETSANARFRKLANMRKKPT